MRRFGLRDDQWERVKDLLPGREGAVGGDRGGQSAVRRGSAVPLSSRDAVARSAGAVRRSRRKETSTCGSAVGPKAVWGSGCFRHLAADADNEYAMIDSTIVRAHQHSAGAKKAARTRRSAARAAD